MRNIELVIKMPEEMYKWVNDANKNLDDYNASDFWELIKNGTSLPEKHGRLIDETKADGLIAEGKDGNKAYFGTTNKDWEVIDFLKTVPTIIEGNE